MIDRTHFSAQVLSHRDARSDAALERIAIAKRRIQSILDTHTVCHQKTLEQKIAEQGPTPQRVHPHLIGLAIKDLLNLNRLRAHTHPSTRTISWYANIATSDQTVQARLGQLAPLYDSVSGHGFGNLTGDALEVIVFKCLEQVRSTKRHHQYQGAFFLEEPKTNGRYRKIQPPKHLGTCTTTKEADFLQHGYAEGSLCIECKNHREWIYPEDHAVKELIIKAADLGAIPLLIAKRFHYTTRTNFLEPAGIIAHETLIQYYPSDKAQIAEQVRHKNSLGFTDVTATEEPHKRTKHFFINILPKLVPPMAQKWDNNREPLLDYALGRINISQLYKLIGSRAAIAWENLK